MKTFTVNCEWKCFGFMEIEAIDEHQAITAAFDAALPDGEYIEDSFRVTSIEGSSTVLSLDEFCEKYLPYTITLNSVEHLSLFNVSYQYLNMRHYCADHAWRTLLAIMSMDGCSIKDPESVRYFEWVSHQSEWHKRIGYNIDWNAAGCPIVTLYDTEKDDSQPCDCLEGRAT